ncbi:MAG: cytochrome C assembly family protein [Kiritimatiellia bacterium]
MEHMAAVLGLVCFATASLLAARALLGTRAHSERGALVFLCLGWVAFAGVLAVRAAQNTVIPAFNCFEALTCYGLALSAAYLLLMLLRPTRGIGSLLIPYSTLVLACGLPGLHITAGPPPVIQNVWLVLHVILAFAAYALLSLASVLAVAYLMQDRNLKHKRLGRVWERLPALETLDHIMGQQLGLGFLLLTGSVLLGIWQVWHNGGGEEWVTDPKVAATAVTWILFAVLVHMRASAGRHGRNMAVVTIVGLFCLLFAFVGVHFVTDSVHSFVGIFQSN